VRSFLDSVVSTPLGAFVILFIAAFLEAYGDSCFQSGLYRSTGVSRWLFFASGTAVLAFYGLTVNVPRWDFGKLLGVYVVLFFVMAQIIARVRFHQSPTVPIYVGGSLILAGGLVITLWKH